MPFCSPPSSFPTHLIQATPLHSPALIWLAQYKHSCLWPAYLLAWFLVISSAFFPLPHILFLPSVLRLLSWRLTCWGEGGSSRIRAPGFCWLGCSKMSPHTWRPVWKPVPWQRAFLLLAIHHPTVHAASSSEPSWWFQALGCTAVQTQRGSGSLQWSCWPRGTRFHG